MLFVFHRFKKRKGKMKASKPTHAFIHENSYKLQ